MRAKLVDHIVANVELGKMNDWVDFYADVMGFRQLVHYDDKAISTEYSALMSKVLWDGEGRIKLPINEPAQGKQEVADRGVPRLLPLPRRAAPGAGTAPTSWRRSRRCAGNGVRFMRVPDDLLRGAARQAGLGQIDEDLAALQEQNILIDTDDEGYLLQIFTEPVQDRPTVFFEVIERHGSKGFGEGNFKALFEAIERDQDLRGNL